MNWNTAGWGERFKAMRTRTKVTFAGAVVAALVSVALFVAGAKQWREDVREYVPMVEKAQDSGTAPAVGEKGGALLPDMSERLALNSGGSFRVRHQRPCRDDMVDVTDAPFAAAYYRFASPGRACGVLSDTGWRHNALTNEGANDVWATYFAASGRSAGQTWYVLLTSATPSATSTLANITEISGNGYARQAITWDFATGRHAKTGNVVFTATAAWSAGATYLGIANASSGTSGKLFNYLALSATRQPAANGDTITASWDGTL